MNDPADPVYVHVVCQTWDCVDCLDAVYGPFRSTAEAQRWASDVVGAPFGARITRQLGSQSYPYPPSDFAA